MSIYSIALTSDSIGEIMGIHVEHSDHLVPIIISVYLCMLSPSTVVSLRWYTKFQCSLVHAHSLERVSQEISLTNRIL